MKKSFLLALGLGCLLVNNVSAKEMVVTNEGLLFDEDNKTIVSIEEGTKVNTIDKLETHKGYYVNHNNKKYFVPNFGLIEPEKYSEYKNYVKSRKPKFKKEDIASVFETVDFKTNDEFVNRIVNEYKPSGKNEEEVFVNLMKYISDLDLNYNYIEKVSQIDTIKYGYTACHGIAYLQKQLLDKTNLKYRVVLETPYNYDKEIADPVSPRHIFNEVQINGKWIKADATELLNIYVDENKTTVCKVGKDNQYILNFLKGTERIYDDSVNISKSVGENKNYPDCYFKVSGTYQSGKNIEDNGFSVIVSYLGLRDYLANQK